MAQFAGFDGAEVEDLLPTDFFVQQVDRWQRGPDEAFADVHRAGTPIVPQIEAWAKAHGITLKAGWKVELAKRVKQVLLQKGPAAVDAATLDPRAGMFHAFEVAARGGNHRVVPEAAGRAEAPQR